jgi:NAD/NADP transhydrogenase alpha subunit
MVSTVLGFVAVTAATINMVGGFVITDRMLKMFRREPTAPQEAAKDTVPKNTVPAKDAKAAGAP